VNDALRNCDKIVEKKTNRSVEHSTCQFYSACLTKLSLHLLRNLMLKHSSSYELQSDDVKLHCKSLDEVLKCTDEIVRKMYIHLLCSTKQGG